MRCGPPIYINQPPVSRQSQIIHTMTKGIFGLLIIGSLISFILAEPPAYGSNNDGFDINDISSFLGDDATGSAAVSGKSNYNYGSITPSTYKPSASSYPLVQKEPSGFNPTNYQESNYASGSQSAPFAFPSKPSGSQLTFPQNPGYQGAQSSAYSGAQSPAYPGAQSPSYPGAQSPSYPGAQSPSYPGVQSPAYPGVQSPAYPGVQSPAYPGAQSSAYSASSYPGPVYPGAQNPSYPGTPQGSFGSYKYPHYPPGGASYNGIHPGYSPYQFEKPNLYQGSSPYAYAGQYANQGSFSPGPPKTSYQSPYKPTGYRPSPYSGASYKPSYSSPRYPSYSGKYSSRPSYSPSPYTSNKPSYSGSSYSGGYKASASKPVAAFAFTDLF